jgi:hypothetical protein
MKTEKTPREIANEICNDFTYNGISVFHMEPSITQAIEHEREKTRIAVEALRVMKLVAYDMAEALKAWVKWTPESDNNAVSKTNRALEKYGNTV